MTALDLAKRWAEAPRILLVGDDSGVAKVVNDMLGHFECEVEVATTLADALNSLLLRKYDVIFVDLGLAGVGVKALQLAHERIPSTPLVVLLSPNTAMEPLLCSGAVTMLSQHLTPKRLKDAFGMFKVRAFERQELTSATA